MSTPQENPEFVLDWPYQVPTVLVQRCVDSAAIERIENSPLNWLTYQRQCIGGLLTHVKAHNPWWDEWLGNASVDDLLGNWGRLPVLSRENLRQSVAAMPSPAVPDGHGSATWHATRGTTGERIEVMWTERMQRMNSHQLHTDHARHGRNLANIRAMIGPLAHDHPGTHTWALGVGELNESPLLVRNDDKFSTLEHLAWLKLGAVQQLTVSTPFLAQLVDVAQGLPPEDRPSIAHILVGAATLTPELRARAADMLQAKVFDRYLCEEVGAIAFQGRNENNPMHVAASHVMVEILRADGTHVDVGERGRVVVTSLHQWAHPVIRYELGDMATWHPICPHSGVQLPTLTGLINRAQ